MLRRGFVVVVLCGAFLAILTSAAWAVWVNGNGQTAESASLGFTAKDDLSGELNYDADPLGEDAGFSAHCDGYSRFTSETSNDGSPMVRVSSVTCQDQQSGAEYRVRGVFTDRGEPGTNDSVCIRFWDSGGNLVIHDRGSITAGNIQIHEDETGGLNADMTVEAEE